MNEREFLRHIPQCDECGELIGPSGGPNEHAILRFRDREYLFHAECAPAICKAGHVTMLRDATIDPAVLARWNSHGNESVPNVLRTTEAPGDASR